MRICSFLPSATEILFALGLGDSVAGVTFECDFPEEARSRRVVVRARLGPSLSPAEINRQVAGFVARGESLYEVDGEILKAIDPDLVITQDLCHVCAATPGDVGPARASLPRGLQVLSLSPRRLRDVWNDILIIGEATGRGTQAAALVRDLDRRLAQVEQAIADAVERPRVLCLEWLDPPFVAGHWVPEMVELAGGSDVLGEPGKPGFPTTWANISSAEPEVVVVMPCGYQLQETVEQFRTLRPPPAWNDLPAVRNGRVYAVGGSSYFSRPGPRLAAGLEILARVLHPELASIEFPAGGMAPLT